jgi:UDP-2,3-diacylglucosamine hydrolase
MSQRERIGIIAGSGRFPILFAETARRRGVDVVAVAHRGETAPELVHHVDAITWVQPGQLQAVIDALRQHGITRTVMVGAIAKPRMFREILPDARALAALSRIGKLRDDLLLRTIAEELEQEGITVVPSTTYLDEIVPAAGVLGRREPTPEEWADIRYGFQVVKAIGRFDIGQSVVVRGGAVMAVEGIEGTDATIRRAGQLVNGDIVVVKATKPIQDLRFDLPAIGPDTIRTIAEVRGRALGIEAGSTIILDRELTLSLADDARIAVVAVDPSKVGDA